jgi:rubredoxin
VGDIRAAGPPACGTCGRTYFLDKVQENRCARMCHMRAHLRFGQCAGKRVRPHEPHAGAPTFRKMCRQMGAPACATCGRTYFLDNVQENGCARMCHMRAHLLFGKCAGKWVRPHAPHASAPLFDTRSDRFLTPVLTGYSKVHNGHLMRHDSCRRRPPIRDVSGRGT